MMKGIEDTNSGIKFEGEWQKVCDFSQELEYMMERFLDSKEEVEEYEEWRPHLKDSDEDMKKKTAEEASIEEKDIERDFNGAEREIDKAEEKIVDSVVDIGVGIDPSQDLKEALLEIEKVVGVESIRSLRKVEETIYKNLMLKMNPYYFDTEDISVNLERKEEDIYCLRLNVSDEDLREHFQEMTG